MDTTIQVKKQHCHVCWLPPPSQGLSQPKYIYFISIFQMKIFLHSPSKTYIRGPHNFSGIVSICMQSQSWALWQPHIMPSDHVFNYVAEPVFRKDERMGKKYPTSDVPCRLSKFHNAALAIPMALWKELLPSNPAIVCIGSVFIAYHIQFIVIINHTNQTIL